MAIELSLPLLQENPVAITGAVVQVGVDAATAHRIVGSLIKVAYTGIVWLGR